MYALVFAGQINMSRRYYCQGGNLRKCQDSFSAVGAFCKLALGTPVTFQSTAIVHDRIGQVHYGAASYTRPPTARRRWVPIVTE